MIKTETIMDLLAMGFSLNIKRADVYRQIEVTLTKEINESSISHSQMIPDDHHIYTRLDGVIHHMTFNFEDFCEG